MSKRFPILYSFLFCILFVANPLKAQQFQLGIVGGLNLSELAGDDISSYVGLNTNGNRTKTMLEEL